MFEAGQKVEVTYAKEREGEPTVVEIYTGVVESQRQDWVLVALDEEMTNAAGRTSSKLLARSANVAALN